MIHSPVNIYRKKQNPWYTTIDRPPPIVFVSIQKRCVDTGAIPPLDEDSGKVLRSFRCDSCEFLNNAALEDESWCHEDNENPNNDDQRIEQNSEYGPHLLSWEDDTLMETST